MKITIEAPKAGEEEEIVIRCKSLDEEIMNLIQALRKGRDVLAGYAEDRIVKLEPKDIFYFESVDNRVYAYTGQEVYEIRKKLYEIEEAYSHMDFLRISKSAIVNVAKIAYLKPIFNGRFETTLKNGEKIIISRQYIINLKRKLGI